MSKFEPGDVVLLNGVAQVVDLVDDSDNDPDGEYEGERTVEYRMMSGAWAQESELILDPRFRSTLPLALSGGE